MTAASTPTLDIADLARSPFPADLYPTIFDSILEQAPYSGLLALRAASREVRRRADALFVRHIAVNVSDRNPRLIAAVFQGKYHNMPLSMWWETPELTDAVREVDLHFGKPVPYGEREFEVVCWCSCPKYYRKRLLVELAECLHNVDVIRQWGKQKPQPIKARRIVHFLPSDLAAEWYRPTDPAGVSTPPASHALNASLPGAAPWWTVYDPAYPLPSFLSGSSLQGAGIQPPFSHPSSLPPSHASSPIPSLSPSSPPLPPSSPPGTPNPPLPADPTSHSPSPEPWLPPSSPPESALDPWSPYAPDETQSNDQALALGTPDDAQPHEPMPTHTSDQVWIALGPSFDPRSKTNLSAAVFRGGIANCSACPAPSPRTTHVFRHGGVTDLSDAVANAFLNNASCVFIGVHASMREQLRTAMERWIAERHDLAVMANIWLDGVIYMDEEGYRTAVGGGAVEMYCEAPLEQWGSRFGWLQ